METVHYIPTSLSASFTSQAGKRLVWGALQFTHFTTITPCTSNAKKCPFLIEF